MQGVQLLDAAAADRHSGVGQTHGCSPAGASRAAASGVVLRPLLAGQGGAAAGPVAHRLGHAQLAVGDLAGELMVLSVDKGGERGQLAQLRFADRVREETEVGGASPWSSPDSAAGGCVGARTPTGSSHTAPCCRCHDPGHTHTHFNGQI